MTKIIESIKAVKPAVVAVAFRQHNLIDKTDQISIAGTGFVFSKEKLFICTCAHVVAPNGVPRTDAQLLVGIVTEDNIAGLPAKIVSIDFKKDLVVLQITSHDNAALASITEVKFGDSTALQQGTDIAFIGFPFGLALSRDVAPSATRGMVSAFRRTASPNREVEFLQLDANVVGGNSGAPVFLPESAEIVGIIKSRFDPLMKGRPPKLIIDGEPLEIFANIGFAQPINITKQFLFSAQ